MQSMQRRFAKLLPRSADEAQVSVLLKEFEDADKMLAKIIDASKAWRDAWTDILHTQHRLVTEFQGLYSPILGAGEGYSGLQHVETPQDATGRTVKIQEGYAELKADLLEEVNMVDDRIVKPATEAKDYIQPLKKVIKQREDRKLDFERYQSRVDNARKKTKRSDRDNAALAKAEADLVRGREEYSAADDHLKSKLPPVVATTYSLLPHLLAAQIMIQNTLLGQYYTMLHTYCQEQNFPSPPPPMSEVISTWDADFKPAQHEIESIPSIAGGKAVRQPMRMEPLAHGSLTGLNLRNHISQRRTSNQAIHPKPSVSPAASACSEPPSPDPNARLRIGSLPKDTSLALSTPNYSSSALTSPSPSDLQSPQGHAPAGPRVDYFSRDRLPSTTSVSSIAAKKKPPPPPPPKRFPSNQGIWVTALYDFAGQGQGDLVFKEGDKIRVTKKTESTDDWWQGELKGVKGSFPANYCQAV